MDISKGRILTVDILIRKDHYIRNISTLCMKNGEILIHCPYAIDVWNPCIKEFHMSWETPRDLKSLLKGSRIKVSNKEERSFGT